MGTQLKSSLERRELRWWLLLCLGLATMITGCGERGGSRKKIADAPGGKMISIGVAETTSEPSKADQFVGSKSCRPCHESFYQLWSTSMHGLAMQPVTAALITSAFTFDDAKIDVGAASYQATSTGGKLYIVEMAKGDSHRYQALHALGGKNVYYLLTMLDRGRLQTLPLAYDVRKKEWFDVALSGVRHFTQIEDAPVHWTDASYTFNTSCYGCHVSQLSTNYDAQSDRYHTNWREPGINCETCHGPSRAHVEACADAAPGERLEDLKIKRTGSSFTHAQNNDTCAPCHAKMMPVSDLFVPGDRFWDHYDLVTLENLDYYPDARDLGENYTITSWQLNPCARSGQMDCGHCHTSSGRFRQKTAPNNACLPCHKERVANAVAHTRHPAGSSGSRCISCHMPMTKFARMRRSDHSMRPPMPAASRRFGSPNACTSCHGDKTVSWADTKVSEWHGDDYQRETIAAGQLVAEARAGRFAHFDDMATYVSNPEAEPIFVNSLVRLFVNGAPPAAEALLIATLEHPSPLVRSSAALALKPYRSQGAVDALKSVLNDDYRLVRVRAAAALNGAPQSLFSQHERVLFDRAMAEYEASLDMRRDDYRMHYNKGVMYAERGERSAAVAAYERSLAFNPNQPAALVNVAMLYNANRQHDKAVAALEHAVSLSDDEAPLLNLGMLYGELKEGSKAREAFKKAVAKAPDNPVGHYNLCVLMGSDPMTRNAALVHCEKASSLAPTDSKYLFSYAYYLNASGQGDEARMVLESAKVNGISNPQLLQLLMTLKSGG